MAVWVHGSVQQRRRIHTDDNVELNVRSCRAGVLVSRFGPAVRRFESASALLSLQKLWSVDTVL